MADAVYIQGTYDGAAGEYRCAPEMRFVHRPMTAPVARVRCDRNLDFQAQNRRDGIHARSNLPVFRLVAAQGQGRCADYGQRIRRGDCPGRRRRCRTCKQLSGSAITGSATYTGGAAGKFAINNPLGGGDGGHFTANATLSAKFGGDDDAGMTGNIDNFMANDKLVPWSVKLNRAGEAKPDGPLIISSRQCC